MSNYVCAVKVIIDPRYSVIIDNAGLGTAVSLTPLPNDLCRITFLIGTHIRRFQPVYQGPRGSCFMKMKPRGRKSRARVNLSTDILVSTRCKMNPLFCNEVLLELKLFNHCSNTLFL
jgi:hypothetical protein